MSTIWDRAVRAVSSVLDERGGMGQSPDGLVSYYCGGPDPRCEHTTCRVVSAIEEADLLHYPSAALDEPVTDDEELDRRTDAIAAVMEAAVLGGGATRLREVARALAEANPLALSAGGAR